MVGTKRVAQRAEVTREVDLRILLCDRRLLLRLRCLHALGQTRKVLAILQRVAEHLVRRGGDGSRVRRRVRHAELLLQRQANRSRQCQLVLLQRVLRLDQLLIGVLVVHLRTQHVKPRAGAGFVRGGGLVQRHLGVGLDGLLCLDA